MRIPSKASLTLAFLATCLVQLALAQLPPAEVHFVDPMNIPLHLSGNFGEMRRNHFHTGLDIKTQKRIGIPVVAVGDGYVSRIKVGPTGYGKAIYITHPEGYTTVYAHISAMAKEIDAFVKQAQYDLEKFTVDVAVPEGKLPVKQGEEIAKSGNEGSSGGPHLHFEIRETNTERPVNPIPFGFSLSDDIAPAIYEIAVIDLKKGSSHNPKFYEVNGLRGKNLSANSGQAIKVPSNEVGLAIRTHDVLNGNSGRCGVREILLLQGRDTVHIRRIDRLDFRVWHQIQAQRMRKPLVNAKKHFQRCYLLPNMSLEMHQANKSNGHIEIPMSEHEEFTFLITDDYGNQSRLNFSMEHPTANIKTRNMVLFECAFDQESLIKIEEASLYLPPFSLYEDSSVRPERIFVDGAFHYRFGEFELPIQGEASISIDPKLGSWEKEHYIEVENLFRKNWDALATTLENGVLKAETEVLGTFRVQRDTIAPVIVSNNVKDDMRGRKAFSLTVHDRHSGIASIEGTLNGKWILLDYDKKNERITYRRDKPRFPSGTYDLHITVVDRVGNVAEFRMGIEW